MTPASFAKLHMNIKHDLAFNAINSYKVVTKDAAIASFNKLDAEFIGYTSYCQTISAVFELMDGTRIQYFVENGSQEYNEAADAIWNQAQRQREGKVNIAEIGLTAKESENLKREAAAVAKEQRDRMASELLIAKKLGKNAYEMLLRCRKAPQNTVYYSGKREAAACRKLELLKYATRKPEGGTRIHRFKDRSRRDRVYYWPEGSVTLVVKDQSQG